MHKRSRQLIALLRKIVTSGLTWGEIRDKASNMPGYGGIILRQFQAHHIREADANPTHSIQSALMNAVRLQGGRAIDAIYDEARISARGVLFDCIVDLHFPGVFNGSERVTEVVNRRQIILDPASLLGSRILVDFFSSRIAQQGAQFLTSLAEEYERLRKATLVGDHVRGLTQQLAMARHWTDCDCPLWLMSRSAILEAGSTLFGRPSRTKWDYQHLKYLLRNKLLIRFNTQPINEVKLDSEPQRGIVGFGITKGLFSHLEKRGFLFLTPRWYHDSDEQIQKMRWQGGQLQSAKKKLGRDSEVYRKLVAAHEGSVVHDNRQDGYIAYERSRRG